GGDADNTTPNPPDAAVDDGSMSVDSGVASPACGAPKIACRGACVDPRVDAKHCGGCDGACTAPEICAAAKGSKVATFAVRKLDVGDSDRTGAKSPNAWESYGRDVDGLATTSIANGACKRVAGATASSQIDGNAGIDNSWGHNVVPLLSAFVP